MYTALKTHKYEREARAAALEDHKSFFAGLLGRADANARAVNPATDPSLAKAAVAARRSWRGFSKKPPICYPALSPIGRPGGCL